MADRLGVIYTPEEIVRFMIDGTNHLLYENFEKTLGDPFVEILDPATGTGTFITEIIESLPENQLDQKYESEIHCNEVAILPYYIANLNIEFTYKQKTGRYKEFENICFVDTLDNMGFSRTDTHQLDFFGLWGENAERINNQNSKKISVIIGNPPYNANQLNENENNKNREYPAIDKRIKESYLKYSTAQKTKLYDMYVRFLRWASDRLSDNGIIAFVSNNSFLDARGYDGFRKVVSNEFSEIYIIDLKGYANTSGERRRKEGGNIFSNQIKVGIAIYFLIKRSEKRGCRIYYNEVEDYATSEAKKSYIRDNHFTELKFRVIYPDKGNNWLNQSDVSWDDLIPIASNATKFSKDTRDQKAIFKNYSLGIVTARDEWVYDHKIENISKKVQYLISTYNHDVERLSKVDREEIANNLDYSIKWTRAVKRNLSQGKKFYYSSSSMQNALYRPYFTQRLYFAKELIEMPNQMYRFFQDKNTCICISGSNSPKPFTTLATNLIPDYNSLSPSADGCRVMPFYDYTDKGERIENITDWASRQYKKYYGSSEITKYDIFNYVYAVLHNPHYIKKYLVNLKRDFPHIPLYDDFFKWAKWGKELMDLHLNFENVNPYPLGRIDKDPATIRKAITPRLIINQENKTIEIDTITTLTDIPNEVFEYQLGTYTAVGWILERYKEKTPKDPTIAEKFNTYKFSDYKEQVIDLIMRVCTVSVETMKIISQMPNTE